MDGLSEILKQKYDPKYGEEDKMRKQEALNRIRVEELKKQKIKRGEKNPKLSLHEILGSGKA